MPMKYVQECIEKHWKSIYQTGENMGYLNFLPFASLYFSKFSKMSTHYYWIMKTSEHGYI